MIEVVFGAALAVAAVEPLPILREPTRPDELSQTFRTRCGRERLLITGIGMRRPDSGSGPSIISNGRRVTAATANLLRRDLSRQAAAYRLVARCLPDRGGILLRVYVGETIYEAEHQRGRREFRVGTALVRHGRVQRYTGLEPTTEDGFWFR